MLFYSDDAGSSFNVSSSTPYETARNQLKGMNEAAFAQLSNGSVLLVMRNLGGHQEHTPGAFHNPACADNGICKAFSRSDDLGLTSAPTRSSWHSWPLHCVPAHIGCRHSWSRVGYFGHLRSGSCEAGVLAHNGSLYISVGDSDAPPNTGRMRNPHRHL